MKHTAFCYLELKEKVKDHSSILYVVILMVVKLVANKSYIRGKIDLDLK